MLEVIGADCGRSGFKGVSDNGRIYFRSAVGTYRQLRNGRDLANDEFIVQYKTEKYFVGRIASEEAEDGAQMFTASKAHTDTKILTLTALHRLVNADARILLVTGLPLSYHTDFDKQQMKRLLVGDHEVTVNGVQKRFSIERVEVAAEGATVAWSVGKTRRERFHIVDIGSRTVNYVTCVNGRWIDRESDSLDYGVETFRGTEAQFARLLISDLSKVLRPFGPVVVIGGRESLASHLREYHPNVEVHRDALFANANAFHELGAMINDHTTAKAASR